MPRKSKVQAPQAGGETDVMARLRQTSAQEGQSQVEEGRKRAEEEAVAPLAEAAPSEAPPPEGAADGDNGKGRKGKGKGKGKTKEKDEGNMGHARGQTHTKKELSDSEKYEALQSMPQINITLLRRDPLSGRTPTIGQWVGRAPQDVYTAESWVRDWSGGGQYTMQVYTPNNQATPYLTKNFDLPGEPRDPATAQPDKEPQQQAPAFAGPAQQQVYPQSQLPQDRMPYMSMIRPGMRPGDRWPTDGRHGRSFRDDDDDESTLIGLVKTMMDRQMGGSEHGYIREQERRDHERRLDDERKERERREEAREQRREEDKREFEKRLEEREKAAELQRAEDQRRWDEQKAEWERRADEDRKTREAKDREEERRRTDDERKHRDEELAREREAHKTELQRIEEKHRAEAKHESERFEQMLKEQNQQAELRQKELTDRLTKAEEDRRREMTALEEKRQDEMRTLKEKNQQQETNTMLERIQSENRTTLERVLNALTEAKGKEDPLLAQVLRGQTESQAQATNVQTQLMNTIVSQMGQMSGKDTETMKILLDVVNPERNIGMYTALADMATKNVDVVTGILSSGLLQQLQGEESSPWVQVVDKVADAITGGAEAVLAAKQQAQMQPQQAARVAQAQAAATRRRALQRQAAPGLALVGGQPAQPAPQPLQPVQPLPQTPGASLGNPPVEAATLPAAGPLQQPVAVRQHEPAPAPAPAETGPAPAATPAEPTAPVAPPVESVEEEEMVVETEGAAAVPLQKIRQALVEGADPAQVAENLYDYVSFLSRWGMLPLETEEAIFGSPVDAVPKLLGAAVASAPTPMVQVEEDYIKAIIDHFVAILEQDREAEAAAAAEAEAEAEEPEEEEEEEEDSEEETPEDVSEEVPEEPS